MYKEMYLHIFSTFSKTFQLLDVDELSDMVCVSCSQKFNIFWKFREDSIQQQNKKIESVNNLYGSSEAKKHLLYEEVSKLKLIDIPLADIIFDQPGPARIKVESKSFVNQEIYENSIEFIDVKKEPSSSSKKVRKAQELKTMKDTKKIKQQKKPAWWWKTSKDC